ncbi:MAG: PadR family transcriptional regulator [Chloroflexota bacterium]
MSPLRQSPLSTELALLGFLRSRPMHGYEIYQLLADSQGLDGIWRMKLSRLYAILGRLEDHQYIVAHTEAQGDRPPRKMFSLTAAGEEVFLEWLTTPVRQPRAMRLEFMLKLYFARLESSLVATQLVALQRRQCVEWLSGPLVASGTEESAEFRAVVSRYRHGQIVAIGEWLDWLTEEIEEVTT